MNSTAIKRIEKRLGVSLPSQYQVLMNTKGNDWKETGAFESPWESLFFDAKKIIDANLNQRHEDAGTPLSFPNWWKTYVLIGTTGFGDYYCLQLDNTPEVWLIGPDCEEEPTLVSESLEAFAEREIAEFQAEKEREEKQRIERALQREPYLDEESAHRQEALNRGLSETAEAWFNAPNCDSMLELLKKLPLRVSPRKMRLFGIACCSRLPEVQNDKVLRSGLALAERLALGTASEKEVVATSVTLRKLVEKSVETTKRWPVTAVHDLFQKDSDYLRGAGIYPHDPELEGTLRSASYALYGSPYGTDAERNVSTSLRPQRF